MKIPNKPYVIVGLLVLFFAVLVITVGPLMVNGAYSFGNSGTGIAPANLARIFDPFFTTKGERGTGLGLYITKQVIEEHHGDITVHSGDRGTTFVISLPH